VSAQLSTPKLILIGLDAATFDVVDPLLESGDLPNLARLFSGGSRGVLRSTTHPLTPHAWSTMVTGVNAARHGIWDFAERSDDGYGLRLVNGSFRRAPALWDRLTAAGRRVGLVNVPFTWPAPRVDGFALAGFDAGGRERGMAYPEGLLDELQERFGRLELDHRFPIGDDGDVDLDRVRRGCEQKVAVTLDLNERFDPDLLFVVFMAADHIHHLAWDAWATDGRDSPVAEVYRTLDAAVGALLDGLGSDWNAMVVSDHGGGALEGVVNLNAWLAANGWLRFADGSGSAGRRAFARLFELRRHLPERLRYSIKQRLPGLRERAYRETDYAVVDWPATQAFAYGTFGNIVLNVRGRESQGIVEPGEPYERLRDEIAARALELAAPDGRPIVTAVYRREELFDGPELEKIPDLVVEFADYAWLGKGNLRSRSLELWDRVEIEPGSARSYVGSHRVEGVVALAGPSAAQGAHIVAGIEDIAPTVLHLLGEPVPLELEGRVLEEAIDPDLLAASPPRLEDVGSVAVGPAEEYSAEESDEVERRLRSLGYVE
jgi:predicted AlkP superfamily phosphohydrolase/phosphomutase